jgi:hypothetical protein
MPEEGLPSLAKKAARAEGDKGIEAKDRRRENERESHNGFEEKFSSPGTESKPIGERQRENEKNQRDSNGETKRE